MLPQAYQSGIDDALKHFAVKEAGIGQWFKDTAKGVGHGLVGHPVEAWNQLNKGTIFKPDGLWHNQIWPTIPKGDLRGKIVPFFGRVGTALTAYELLQNALGKSGDPNESRLTNMLTTAGTSLGGIYGLAAGGALGTGLGSTAGNYVGKFLGHHLSSKPQPPSMPQPQIGPDPAYDYGQFNPALASTYA